MKIYQVAAIKVKRDLTSNGPGELSIVLQNNWGSITMAPGHKYYLVKDSDELIFLREYPDAVQIVVERYGNFATVEDLSRFANIKVE